MMMSLKAWLAICKTPEAFNPPLQPTSNRWLCGGALRSIYLGQPIRDWDYFYPGMCSFSNDFTALDNSGKNPPFVNNSWQSSWHFGDTPVQLVKQFSTNLTTCIHRFDFTICMIGTDGTYVYLGETTKEDLDNRTLSPNVLEHPITSLRRIQKFATYGFMLTNATARQVGVQLVGKPINTYLNPRTNEVTEVGAANS